MGGLLPRAVCVEGTAAAQFVLQNFISKGWSTDSSTSWGRGA